MNAFHEYLTQQIGDHLQKRRVVVWYDPNEEFSPYVAELPRQGEADGSTEIIGVGQLSVRLIRYAGSLFEVKAKAEPFVAIDQPEPLLVYIPGIPRDKQLSPVMELEQAGHCYEPQLKRLARNVLRQSTTDGVIDTLLAPDKTVTYRDVVAFLAQQDGGHDVSMLKVVFETAKDSSALLASWLADSSNDEAIREKDARAELFQLIEMRLGLEMDSVTELADARAKTARYLLAAEFRSDLVEAPPDSLGMISEPSDKLQLDRCRDVAAVLRADHAGAYLDLADRVQDELSLAGAGLAAGSLGTVDTFRFEESLLLKHCGQLIADQEYADALDVVEQRGLSFWVQQDVARQAQWGACRLMAELGQLVGEIEPEVESAGRNADVWVDAYAQDEGGWYRVDMAHRNLQAWVARMEDEPEAGEAVAAVQGKYEVLLRKMADGFTDALTASDWSVVGGLAQSNVYEEVVASRGGRVAYFLVDAMRYEMGVELARRLAKAQDMSIRPGIAMAPTITPIGMAALLPGASSSFSVVAEGGRLGARINGAFLPGVAERIKHLKASSPGAVDLLLDDLLTHSPSKVKRRIADAELITVRSQEIDSLGESGSTLLARQLMESAVANIARGVRKLATFGIEQFVICADHGYQFSMAKGDDMKIDKPGGDTVDIHRRCWIGRGGTTPPGTVRISGTELGYDTDLDFVFPTGLAVFKAGGDLSFHHGGLSLQELIVPVVSLRIPAATEEAPAGPSVTLSGCPDTITNRTFAVTVRVEQTLFGEEAVKLRMILVDGGRQVGQAAMAIDAEIDRATGIVQVTPGKEASVGLMLERDECDSLRIVAHDPQTDVVMAQSKMIDVRLGI